VQPLSYEDRNYRVTTHQALDTFIRQFYPHWDGVLSDMDWYPGHTYPITVRGEDSTRDEWVAFIERREQPYGRISGRSVLSMLLNHLASEGHMSEGEYLVKVEW